MSTPAETPPTGSVTPAPNPCGVAAPTGAFASDRFETEATEIGPQSLVTGVAPITPRDRLAWRANAPMQPKKPQRPADHGLFDTNARNQMEMFG